MSAYQVNKVCWRAQHDKPFRERLQADPAATVAVLPLTAEEREALLAGNVARLYQLGAHPYLLGHLPRFQVVGLNREGYVKQMTALLDSPGERARAALAGSSSPRAGAGRGS